MRGLRHRRRRVPAKDPEIDRALEAMSAPELRAAVRAVLDELDEDVKASVVDTLIGASHQGLVGLEARTSVSADRGGGQVVRGRGAPHRPRRSGRRDRASPSGHESLPRGRSRERQSRLRSDLAADRQRRHRSRPARARRGGAGSRRAGVRRAVRRERVHHDAASRSRRRDTSRARTGRGRRDAFESDQGYGGRLGRSVARSQGVPSAVGEAPPTVPPVEGRVGDRARAMAARGRLSCGRRRRSRADCAKDEAASGVPRLV